MRRPALRDRVRDHRAERVGIGDAGRVVRQPVDVEQHVLGVERPSRTGGLERRAGPAAVGRLDVQALAVGGVVQRHGAVGGDPDDHRAPTGSKAGEKRGATSRANRSAQRCWTARGAPGRDGVQDDVVEAGVGELLHAAGARCRPSR